MKVSVRGVELFYEVRGEGLPLLCVHGFPLTGKLWWPLSESLSDRCKLIIPDLRGHGQSEVSESVTMADYADDLAALLKAIGVAEPVVVVGLSMGGYISFEFYRRHRDRVRALVLADTRANADSQEVLTARRETAAQVLQEGSKVVADSMVKKLFAPDAPPALRDEWHKIMAATDPRGVAAALDAMAGRPDSFDTLRSVNIPTLVVVGEKDAITPVDCAQKMLEAAKGSQLEIIPGVGHMVPVEAPVAFANILGRFLDNIEMNKRL